MSSQLAPLASRIYHFVTRSRQFPDESVISKYTETLNEEDGRVLLEVWRDFEAIYRLVHSNAARRAQSNDCSQVNACVLADDVKSLIELMMVGEVKRDNLWLTSLDRAFKVINMITGSGW